MSQKSYQEIKNQNICIASGIKLEIKQIYIYNLEETSIMSRVKHRQIVVTPRSDQKKNLQSQLTCFLCQNMVKKTQICPTCPKILCSICKNHYLYNYQNKCLNCFDMLAKDKIIKCFKQSQQLIGTLNKLNKLNQLDSFNKSEDHRLSKSYYCTTCNKEVYSNYCVITSQHSGHKFTKLKSIKQNLQEKKNEYVNKIRRIRQKIENEAKNIRISNVMNQSQLQFKKIQSHLSLLNDKMKKNIDQQINYMEIIRNYEFNNLNQLTKTYQFIAQQINKCPKAKFVKEVYHSFHNLIQKCILQCSNQSYNQQNFDITHKKIENQLIPQYRKKIFILDNYSFIRMKKQCVYSEVFFTNGLEWRLKIYPNGNNEPENGIDTKLKERRLRNESLKSPKIGNYLSIFIELKSGLQKLGRYKHKIEIENENNPNLKISRQFESDFESGECWGYNNFVRIQTLYDEGYINPKEDLLKISLCVCPATYYSASLDQQQIINSKLAIIQSNEKMIKQLCQKLESTPKQYKIEQMTNGSNWPSKYDQQDSNTYSCVKEKKGIVMSSTYVNQNKYNSKLSQKLKKSKSNDTLIQSFEI